MAQPRVSAAGGLAAMKYVLARGRDVGMLDLYRRLRSRNACKTCALGMGGQAGGMVNEQGHFPEVCKKSVQAQAADMGRVITEDVLADLDLAALEHLTSAQAEALGRLTFPIVCREGDDHYRRASWDEALDLAGAGFTAADPSRSFWYTSGRSSNEAGFLLQLIARAYGTSNINSCSYYCHNASGVALTSIYGSSTASVELDDLARTDLVVLAGANPASNHPRLMTQLIHLRRRGGKVIVINPLSELGLRRFRLPSDARSLLLGSEVSDLYLQPHIGGDAYLFTAMLKGLIERGATDDDFLDTSTTGWEDVRAFAEAQSWEDLIEGSGVRREDIDAAVTLLAQSTSGIFMWAMGLTHHVNGTDTVRALGNVAMARGFLGRPGSGLMPIRGHSNVQGVGSMGVSPTLKESFAQHLAERYGISPDMPVGYDTYAGMASAHEGGIDAALMLGGNLWGSNPDSAWATEALARIGTTVSLTTKLNQGHFRGRGRTSIVLPVLARDEEEQATTQESMFNYVRLSDGGSPSVPGEMRSEVAVLADLADRILPPGRYDWAAIRSHEALRAAIADAVPGYEAIATIGSTGSEFAVAGRVLHGTTFPTADTRAHLHVVPLPPRIDDEGYTLMTIRSEGQFNTVVYDEEDLYRGNATRDVVMMSAEDAASLGVVEGDVVVVASRTGRMRVKAAIVDIRPGNLAMYYPEANVLVDRALDAESLTPAFKAVRVTLEAEHGS